MESVAAIRSLPEFPRAAFYHLPSYDDDELYTDDIPTHGLKLVLLTECLNWLSLPLR